MAINPTKTRLRHCRIQGVDIKLHTNCIKVYESMCRPYITTEYTIVDNNNVINGLNLRGGEPISFAFDGGDSRVYSTTHYITNITGEASGDNLRTMIYTINAAGPSYFYDRANLVQRSDVNIPASSVIQSIFSQYLSGDAPLNIFSSLGMIAKQDIGGFVTANKKPFTAISDIMKRMSFGGYKSGSPVFFRNRDEYVIAPLEHLFATAGAQESFEQRATWGSEWQHVFTSRNAIINAGTINEADKDGTARGGASNLAQAASGALNMFDISQGKETIPAGFGQAAQAASAASAGGVGKFVRGKLGGIQNVLQMDSRRNDPSNEQGMNAVAENMFKATVKDGVQYLIKVPIQTGLNVTVGRGINAKLIPPTGDLNRGKTRLPSHFLVADLCHEVYFDNRLVQGTTTMRSVSIGYNV